jgi:hypothetical protein
MIVIPWTLLDPSHFCSHHHCDDVRVDVAGVEVHAMAAEEAVGVVVVHDAAALIIHVVKSAVYLFENSLL